MRRPLFMVCLCLVAAVAVWLQSGTPPNLPARLLPNAQSGFLSNPREALREVIGREVKDGDNLTVTGQVYRKETRTRNGNEVYLIYLNSITIHKINQSTANNCQFSYSLICEMEIQELSSREELSNIPAIGEHVLLSGSFSFFPTARNPGEFDLEQYYRILSIGGRLRNIEILGKNEQSSWFKEGLYRLREHWKSKLSKHFPQKEASIMAAVLLGDKGSLDSEIRELYKRNGILHILSISGLHITIIGIGVYRILRKVGCPIWVAAVAGGSFLLLYGIMAGMEISAYRAIGMYLIRMAGECLGRTFDMLTALGIMAVIMLIRQPEYLRHSGFLLSFGSVCGIGILLPSISVQETLGEGESMNIGKLKQSMSAGISVIIFTLPIHLWYYFEIPIYSLLLNLLTLPLMGILMTVGMAVMMIPGMGFLAIVDKWILLGYEWLCILCNKLPFHTWTPGQPREWQIVLFYILLTALIFLGKHWKWHWKALLLTVSVIVLGFRISNGITISFLDVGQGDCIYVRTDSQEVYLFDGGSTSRSQVGKYTILPYLKQQGITYIDAIFVSHPDMDHYSGVLEILELGRDNGIVVGRLVLPGIEEEAREREFEELLRSADESGLTDGVPVSYMAAGSSWSSGNVTFTCLHPSDAYLVLESNAYSQCFLMEYGNFSMLLTGDVEGVGEDMLLNELTKRQVEDITILKVAHHGSRNSTGDDILRILQPKLAIISCGENNRYGHPHEELLERLRDCGASVLQTPEAGAIWVEVSEKEGEMNKAAVHMFLR